jgi:hypothetical protein
MVVQMTDSQTITNFKKRRKYFNFVVNDFWVVNSSDKIEDLQTFQQRLYSPLNLSLLYCVNFESLTYEQKEEIIFKAFDIERKFLILLENQQRGL